MRGWTILIGAVLVGVILGVVGTLKFPSWAEPYLHARFSPPTHRAGTRSKHRRAEPPPQHLRRS